jgi:hypothetical protein
MNKWRDGHCIARSRSRACRVPFGLEMGEPEDVAPMAGSSAPTTRTSPARSTRSTVAGSRWGTSRPRWIRTAGGRSTSSQRLDEVGQEPMPILAALAEREPPPNGDKPNNQ